MFCSLPLTVHKVKYFNFLNVPFYWCELPFKCENNSITWLHTQMTKTTKCSWFLIIKFLYQVCNEVLVPNIVYLQCEMWNKFKLKWQKWLLNLFIIKILKYCSNTSWSYTELQSTITYICRTLTLLLLKIPVK